MFAFISTTIAQFSILWTAPYLTRLTCYLNEKYKNVRNVTVHSVTFYVNTVAIVCNGVDIFMVTLEIDQLKQNMKIDT